MTEDAEDADFAAVRAGLREVVGDERAASDALVRIEVRLLCAQRISTGIERRLQSLRVQTKVLAVLWVGMTLLTLWRTYGTK